MSPTSSLYLQQLLRSKYGGWGHDRTSSPKWHVYKKILAYCQVLFPKGTLHNNQRVTTIEVYPEWSIGDVMMCLVWKSHLVNASVMPETVYETVFGNVTKEKGSVTFVNMLPLMAGVESNPGPTGKEPMDLDILYQDDVNEDRGECQTTSFI